MSTEAGGNAEQIRQLLQQEQASLQNVENATDSVLNGPDKSRKAQLLAKMAAYSDEIADELESDEIETRQKLNTPDTKAEDERSLRGKGKSLEVLLGKLFAKLRGNKNFGEQEMMMPKMDNVSRFIFNKLLEQIRIESLNIEVIPYVFTLLFKALRNEINEKNIFDILSTAKLLKIGQYNEQLFQTIVRVLYEAAVTEANIDMRKAQDWASKLTLLQQNPNSLDPMAGANPMNPRRMMRGERLGREKVEAIDKKIRSIVAKVNAKYPGQGSYYVEYVANGADDFERLYGYDRRAQMDVIDADASIKTAIPELATLKTDLDQEGYFAGLIQAASYNGMIDEAEEVMRLINPNIIFQNLITPEGMWNHFGADNFRRKMGEFINSLFKNALSNPYADFRENFNPGMEGMILNQTRTYVFKMATDSLLPNAYEDLLRRRRDDPNTPQDVKDYLTDAQILSLKEAYRDAFRKFFNDLGGEINQQYKLTELSHNTRRQSDVDSKQRVEYHDQFKQSEMRKILRGKPLLQEAEWVYALSHAWRAAENNNFIPDGYMDPQEIEDPVTGLKTQENVDLRRFIRNMQRMIRRVRLYKAGERDQMLEELSRLRREGRISEANQLQEKMARFYIDRENEIPESEFTSVVPIAEFFNRILTDEESMYMGRTLVYGSAKALEDRPQPSPFASGWRLSEAARASAEFYWSVGRGRHYVESPVANMQAASWIDDPQTAYDRQLPRMIPMGATELFSVKNEWDKMVTEVRMGQPIDEPTMKKRLESAYYDTHKSMRQHYEELLFVQNWKYDGGYALENLKVHFQDETGKSWGSVSRQEQEVFLERFAGFGSKFSFLKGYVEQDKKKYLGRVWGIKDTDSDEFHAKLGQYGGLQESRSMADSLKLSLGLGGMTKNKDKYQRFIPVQVRRHGGRDHGIKVSVSEFESGRLEAERAKITYEALRKQPVVFLTHMIQMLPEIADGYIEVKAPNGDPINITAAEFYLDTNIQSRYIISDSQKKQIHKVYNDVRIMFGEQNIPEIRKVMGFFQDAYREFAPQGTTDEPIQGKQAAFDALFAYGNAASTIARLEGTDVKPEYIISDQEIADYRANPGRFDQEEKIDIEERIKVRRLLFESENAIVTHFRNYVESEGFEKVFGSNEVPDNGDIHLGDRQGFFQRFVKTWYGIKNIQYDPLFFRSTYGMISPFPQSNDVGKRKEADKGTIQETVLANREKFEGAVVNFVNGEGGEEDSAIDGVFKAQAELFDALWKVDKTKAQPAMKQYTIDFFKYAKGAASGLPFPFDAFLNFILGKQASNAKHDLGLPNLRTLNDDQMNDYINRLILNDYITKEQAQEIRLIMQLEGARFYGTSVLPTLGFALISIMLIKYIQEAVKENTKSG